MEEKACVLEAVLFAFGDPLSLDELSLACGEGKQETKRLLSELKRHYEEGLRGIALRTINGKYQLSANPVYHNDIKKLAQEPPSRPLTAPLIETLAIIAYKQPATKAMIEEIRGVNADHCVNKLLEYDLICEKGRLDIPGKPLLFGTTDEFLRHFGFSGLSDLPDEGLALAAEDSEA